MACFDEDGPPIVPAIVGNQCDDDEGAQAEETKAHTMQDLKDRVLIVVGQGGAVERLARRRLDANGRLCLVEIDSSVKVSYREVDLQSMPDLWSPPPSLRSAAGPGRKTGLAARFHGSPQDNWVKLGPDVVQLSEGDELVILSLHGEDHVGIQALRGGTTQWEMSGFVIINPSEEQAVQEKVSVQNPEKISFATCSYRAFALLAFLYVALLTPCIAVSFSFERHAQDGQLPWWRSIVWVPTMCIVIFHGAVPVWFLAFTGFKGTRVHKVLAMIGCVIVIVVFLNLNLSGTITAILCPLPTLWLSLIWLCATRKEAPQRRAKFHFDWGNNAVNLTVLSCLLFTVVALLYLVLLDLQFSIVAAAVLSWGVTFVEAAALFLTVRFYNAYVVKPRSKQTGAVHGDQRGLVLILPAINHGWAEGTRMASLLAGTAKDPHDLGWIFSLFLTLLLNVLNRCGWLIWLSNRVYRVIGQDVPYNCAVRILNGEARKYCGYPRFASFIAVMLARLVVHRELDPSKPGCAYFNHMTLAAFLALIAFEVLEDVIVHMKFIKWPAFVPDTNEKAHTGMGNDHISQMVALKKMPGQDGAWAVARPSQGGKPCCAFSLHGVRLLSTADSIGLVFVMANNTLHMLQILFGDGFLVGVCAESGLSISRTVLSFFVVETPYACS